MSAKFLHLQHYLPSPSILLLLLFRLGKLWMYDAPTMFWAVWQLVSPFIDPATKEKVTFVNSKSAIKEFQDAIDPSVSLLTSCMENLIAIR